MIASWPPELPRPMRNGYSQTPGEARFKRSPEAGPPGYRRRFSAVAEAVSMMIDVSRDGRARFERFYFEETAHGSLPFAMPDPATDGWGLLSGMGEALKDETGAPLLIAATWLCLFGDQRPSYSAVGVRWRISFSIAVMP